MNHIDLSTVLRQTVACDLYSNLVTRPTGAAVRGQIERLLNDTREQTLTVIDFSQVSMIDFSCADEVIAKLLLRYCAEDPPREAFFLFRGVTSFAQNYLMDLVGQRIICDLRDELNQHIQRLSLAFFNRTPTGDILSRVTNDVALVRTALTDAVASVMRDSTSLVALIVVAFLKDPALALIAFLVFPASVVPILKLSKRLRRFSKRG